MTIVALAVGLLASTTFALEGGMTSDSRQWSPKITHEKSDEATRATELAARKAAIQADIARLKERLTRVPSQDKMAELHKKLNEIVAKKGWCEELGMVMGIRDIEPMLKPQEKNHPGMVEMFVQMKEDFAKRGIDLIVVPMVPTPHFGSHVLVDGIEAEHEYYPGWTKMMLELLEADVEVIDTVSEFRKHAKDDLIVSWPNDFHTGSGGRKIAAAALAERLQRYDFVRDLAPNKDKFKYTEATQKSTKTRIGVVNTRNKNENHKEKLKDRTFKILKINLEKGTPDLRRSELVMIGDSQLHSAVYGSGFPAFVNAAVGGVFRWGSKSGFNLPEVYLQVVPDYAVQPRVVVMACMTKYWWKPGVKPIRMPGLGEVDKSGIPTQEFYAEVEILKMSKAPTDDPKALDYDNAIYHIAAKIVDGPDTMKGKEIGLRCLAMYKGKFSRAPEIAKPGAKMKLRLISLDRRQGASARTQSQWEVFDTVDQDLTIPIFWVEAGPLSWGNIRVR